jgi:5-formyltetrahydrofolate cyclo-ligase
MLKADARKIFIEKRSSLTMQEKMKMDDLLLIQLQTTELPFITFLLSYWPIEEKNEPNTHLYTDYLGFLNPEIVVCYPKVDLTSFKMHSIQTNDDTRFIKNNYQIYEPQNGDIVNPAGLDMIFVPLLAVDKKGFRVGYGKGYYDRFLSKCRTNCLKIGFSYFEPLDAIEDTHQFDVPLDLCVTPTSVYVF